MRLRILRAPTPESAMPATAASHRPAAHAVISRLLWQWLTVGALLWLLFPALRGPSPLLGNGSLWLLVLPASALLTFHRERLARVIRG